MKDDYSSFICEHTAEYVLIPKLVNILKQGFEVVVPIFPWMTREGSNLSRTIHSNTAFKVLGLYPKRPKIKLSYRQILIKINNEFLDAAQRASEFNIPMITGCPLARNLWELNEQTYCIWIKLTDKTKPFYLIKYNDGVSSEYKTLPKNEVLEYNEDILKFIINNSKEFEYKNFIHAIRDIKEHTSNPRWLFGNYKPIYFLLKKN